MDSLASSHGREEEAAEGTPHVLVDSVAGIPVLTLAAKKNAINATALGR